MAVTTHYYAVTIWGREKLLGVTSNAEAIAEAKRLFPMQVSGPVGETITRHRLLRVVKNTSEYVYDIDKRNRRKKNHAES